MFVSVFPHVGLNDYDLPLIVMPDGPERLQHFLPRCNSVIVPNEGTNLPANAFHPIPAQGVAYRENGGF